VRHRLSLLPRGPGRGPYAALAPRARRSGHSRGRPESVAVVLDVRVPDREEEQQPPPATAPLGSGPAAWRFTAEACAASARPMYQMERTDEGHV